jgi:hypothetical protein
MNWTPTHFIEAEWALDQTGLYVVQLREDGTAPTSDEMYAGIELPQWTCDAPGDWRSHGARPYRVNAFPVAGMDGVMDLLEVRRNLTLAALNYADACKGTSLRERVAETALRKAARMLVYVEAGGTYEEAEGAC